MVGSALVQSGLRSDQDLVKTLQYNPHIKKQFDEELGLSEERLEGDWSGERNIL